MNKEKLLKDIKKQYSNEALDYLMEMLEIESYRHPALPNMPYGKETDDVLEFALNWAKQNNANNIYKDPDGYYEFADWGTGDNLVGILAHLDVVGPGDKTKWTHDPFQPIIKGEYLYGRVALDTKGPDVAAMYAVKYLIENNVDLKNTKIRIVFGLNEEENMQCVIKYKKESGDFNGMSLVTEPAPTLVRGLKGVIRWNLKTSGCDDFVINARTDFNMICDRVNINFTNTILYKKVSEYLKTNKWEYEQIGDNEIAIVGKPGHGSMPELGVNAIILTAKMFKNINYTNNKMINWIANIFGEDYNMTKICGDLSDKSGKLTFNLGKFRINKDESYLGIDNRVIASKPEKELITELENTFKSFDITYEIGNHIPPVLHEETPFVLDMMKLVEQYSIYGENDYVYVGGLSYSNIFKDSYTVCVTQNLFKLPEVIPGQYGPHAYNERFHLKSWDNVIAFYVELIKHMIK